MTENLPTINYEDPKMIATLRATVAVGATDEEFAMFAGLCRSTGLNPFKREVWFIKTKGYTKKDGSVTQPRVQIMTGLNGFLAIANKNPAYDGLESEIERDKNGLPVRAIAKVWRKDRKFPAVGEALWNEYYKPNAYGHKGVWEQMPSIMLAKCAKSLALREAFPQELNGLYTEEEMPKEYAVASDVGSIKVGFDKIVLTERPRKNEERAEEQTLYDFSEARLTEKQLAFLKEHCSFDEGRGLWVCAKDLGSKLAKYRVVGKTKEAPARAENSTKEADMAEFIRRSDELRRENEAADDSADDLPESMGGAAESAVPTAEDVAEIKRIQERVRNEKLKGA